MHTGNSQCNSVKNKLFRLFCHGVIDKATSNMYKSKTKYWSWYNKLCIFVLDSSLQKLHNHHIEQARKV